MGDWGEWDGRWGPTGLLCTPKAPACSRGRRGEAQGAREAAVGRRVGLGPNEAHDGKEPFRDKRGQSRSERVRVHSPGRRRALHDGAGAGPDASCQLQGARGALAWDHLTDNNQPNSYTSI